MKNETKQIFDSPWSQITSEDYVVDSLGLVVCKCDNPKTTNRISHLPELYDTLFEITMERCARCVATHANCGIQAPLGFDFFTGECPFETDKYYDGDPCVWRQRWKLLGKVRNGQK